MKALWHGLVDLARGVTPARAVLHGARAPRGSQTTEARPGIGPVVPRLGRTCGGPA